MRWCERIVTFAIDGVRLFSFSGPLLALLLPVAVPLTSRLHAF